MTKFQNEDVKNKFSTYPKEAKEKLLELRELIFTVASKNKSVGELEECLKWNEPSYLTSQSKSRSTLRIDWKQKSPDQIHIYVNCKTKLITIYKELFSDDFEYDGNRCISLPINKRLPKRKLSKLIKIALTYNFNNYKDFL